MGIGASIFLIAVGAILTFALRDNANIGFLDLDVVGVVLMIAGLAGLILTMWFWQSRRRPAVGPGSVTDDRVVEEQYREVRRDDRGL